MPADGWVYWAVLESQGGEHKEDVADIYSLGHTVLDPHCRMASPDGITVLEVIMHEGGVVQELAGGCDVDGFLRIESEGHR